MLPSRRLDCEAYSAVAQQGLWQRPTLPLLPSLDEEYFEWLDVLSVVDAAQVVPRLVVVEVGTYLLYHAYTLCHTRRASIGSERTHRVAPRPARLLWRNSLDWARLETAMDSTNTRGSPVPAHTCICIYMHIYIHTCVCVCVCVCV